MSNEHFVLSTETIEAALEATVKAGEAVLSKENYQNPELLDALAQYAILDREINFLDLNNKASAQRIINKSFNRIEKKVNDEPSIGDYYVALRVLSGSLDRAELADSERASKAYLDFLNSDAFSNFKKYAKKDAARPDMKQLLEDIELIDIALRKTKGAFTGGIRGIFKAFILDYLENPENLADIRAKRNSRLPGISDSGKHVNRMLPYLKNVGRILDDFESKNQADIQNNYHAMLEAKKNLPGAKEDVIREIMGLLYFLQIENMEGLNSEEYLSILVKTLGVVNSLYQNMLLNMLREGGHRIGNLKVGLELKIQETMADFECIQEEQTVFKEIAESVRERLQFNGFYENKAAEINQVLTEKEKSLQRFRQKLGAIERTILYFLLRLNNDPGKAKKLAMQISREASSLLLKSKDPSLFSFFEQERFDEVRESLQVLSKDFMRPGDIDFFMEKGLPQIKKFIDEEIRNLRKQKDGIKNYSSSINDLKEDAFENGPSLIELSHAYENRVLGEEAETEAQEEAEREMTPGEALKEALQQELFARIAQRSGGVVPEEHVAPVYQEPVDNSNFHNLSSGSSGSSSGGKGREAQAPEGIGFFAELGENPLFQKGAQICGEPTDNRGEPTPSAM